MKTIYFSKEKLLTSQLFFFIKKNLKVRVIRNIFKAIYIYIN